MSQNKEESEPSLDRKVITEMNISYSGWLSAEGFEDEDIKDYTNRITTIILKYIGLDKYASTIEVSLLLTDDEELQRLNREFRHQDKPTNVLSFPAHDLKEGELQEIPHHTDNSLFIGDIAISYQRIYEESIEQHKSFKEHFAHIIVHSVLHLSGYDHIHDEEAEKMEKLEASILAVIGIKNPYALENVTHNSAIKF